MIKLLIADDHVMFLQGLVSILNESTDLDIVATAKDGEEALLLLKENKIDLAILDIRMPVKDGIETTKYIKQHHPDVKILIVSMLDIERDVLRAAKANADGYILKDSDKSDLLAAIHKIYNGGLYFSDKVLKILIHKAVNSEEEVILKSKPVNTPLTKRELEVLNLLVKGDNVPKIAKKLFISKHTVEAHKRNMLDKLDIKNLQLLIKYAIENKIT